MIPTSPVIDVVVGLLFFFTMLSLLSSTIQERLAAAFDLRARGLESWITSTLGSDAAKRFYQHPLIAGLGGTRASYISAQAFAMALFDAVGVTAAEPASLVPASDPLHGAAVGDAIRKTLADLPDGPAARALLAHLDHAQGDVTMARASVESWFDGAMQRLSGVYKRRAHWSLIGIAAVLAVVLNADTLRVARVLYRDPIVRAAFAEQARNVGQRAAPTDADVKKLIADLPLPIGWRGDAPASTDAVSWLLEKCFGLLLTVAAISLGAPFWFDLLNQVANLRAAGDRPPTASDPARRT